MDLSQLCLFGGAEVGASPWKGRGSTWNTVLGILTSGTAGPVHNLTGGTLVGVQWVQELVVGEHTPPVRDSKLVEPRVGKL